MRHPSFRHTASAALFLCTLAGSAVAADGFKVRYPLSGSLGGEIVAPVDNPGFFASVVLTQIEVDKLTDGSGNDFVQVRAGSLTTPPIAGAARTASYSGLVKLDLKQKQTNLNLIVGYLSEPNFRRGTPRADLQPALHHPPRPPSHRQWRHTHADAAVASADLTAAACRHCCSSASANPGRV